MDYSTQDYNAASQSHYTTSVPGVFKEAVGVFKSAETLQNAIRALEGTSFPRQDISVMGSRNELQGIFGTKTVMPEFAMDNADTPRQAPSRPEEQTIGTAGMIGGATYIGAMAMALTTGAVAFPAIITAAVIGGLGGGTLGAILVKILGDRYTRHLEEQIERGGLLLWVRTPDKDLEELAKRIMVASGAYDVHVHQMV